MLRSFSFVLSLLSMVACVSGFFNPLDRRSATSLPLMAMDAPPATPIIAASTSAISPISFGQRASGTTSSSSFSEGICRYLSQDESSFMSSTTVLSLKERPPPPTAEELAAKKATFNLWFWGGGFVAPFLATFYYFGFKFWER